MRKRGRAGGGRGKAARVGLVFLLGCLGLSTVSGFAQESVYYRNFVRHADGSEALEQAPQAAFTVFLNGDEGRILIDNAPRWDDGGDPNIDGNGTFGVELGNFPELAVGDTVTVRFTIPARGERGVLTEVIPAIPWSRFPQTLHLEAAEVPAAPQEVSLDVEPDGQRVVTWAAEAERTYTVYRRTVQDTLPSGVSRRLYTRVAMGLTDGSFRDDVPDPDLRYGYIVYAEDPSGTLSAHSAEALTMENIPGLTVTAGATNATLSWPGFSPSTGAIQGFNIYRQQEGEAAARLIAFTGPDTVYTDTRLEPGVRYTYYTRGRIDERQEAGQSDEVVVTTGTDPGGTVTYASLKTAVVIYLNTNQGSIPPEKVEAFRRMLEVGRLFYWRNSGLKLNLEMTYYVIPERQTFASREDLAVQQTARLLADRGVMNTQYDLVFRITPATDGYWSFGVIDLSLPGPARPTGFSQSQYPYGTGVVYPGHEPGLDYGLTWIFVHEAQHAIDAVYNANGHPEMAHGDIPWIFSVPKGEHFDFQAKILRTFAAYEVLAPAWGDLYEAPDADADGFPDADPRVPLDELRFGSSPQAIDTDQDGLDDRAEALDGIYTGANPADPDTDRDGRPDGSDPHPRYRLHSTAIAPFTPQIDGTVEPEWPLMADSVSYTQRGYAPKLYMGYDADSLYLALALPNIGVPELWFDFGADGFWHGRGNTMMRINLSQGTFSELRTRDAGPEARAFSENGAGLWDDEGGYELHFGSRILRAGQVNLAVNLEWPAVQIELAIPRRERHGLALQPGDSLGLYINYGKVNNQPDQWATTFDQYSFVTFRLGATGVGVDEAMPSADAEAFRLDPNFPNPFRQSTTLRYVLDRPQPITLRVFDALGRHVRTLVDAEQPAGVHDAPFDARGLAPGVYFVRLTGAKESRMRSILLIDRPFY